MDDNVKPRVVISKCIEFDHCRYNAQIISSKDVAELKSYVELIPICPEVEIGLGTPRDPIRIVYIESKYNLIQPSTGKNITKKMNEFINNFFNSISNIDGFILKSRSPSCGIKEVKIYDKLKNGFPIYKKAGFFGQAVLNSYPFIATEDEGRLRNPTIREHFLRSIFTFARFREIQNKKSISSLIQFHTKNKFLLMAYNQSKLKQLGRIVATAKQYPLENVLSNYKQLLYEVFYRSPRCTSNINVLLHIFGYVSDELSKDEKKYFLNQIEKYRQANISLASVITILKSWIIRFGDSYLKQQTFFSPYPDELVHAENIDSCISRDYWK